MITMIRNNTTKEWKDQDKEEMLSRGWRLVKGEASKNQKRSK